MSKRKSTSKAKLKTASQIERIQIWKEHFKTLLGNFSKVTDKLIKNYQYIKQGQHTQEEFIVVLTKIKNRKAVGRDKISPDVYIKKKKEI